jgi:tetratricopeptide (TPR) repeat protein
MKQKLNSRILLLAIPILFVLCRCNDKLDIKPNQSFLVPSSLAELQAVVDHDFMNNSFPFGMEVATDNFVILDTRFSALELLSRKIYTWDEKVYEGASQPIDWVNTYRSIFYANVALDKLKNLNEDQSPEQYRNIKGQALFIRSFYYHFLAEQYCKQYIGNSAETELGLPLKLTSDINEMPKRSTLKKTYEQIINDLKQAVDLLPLQTVYKSRPSKAAANALLARVYLNMNDFANSLLYANEALKINPSILDYNKLNSSDAYPIKLYNSEVLFDGRMNGSPLTLPSSFFVDPILYNSYEINDLRKSCFFSVSSNGILFKGSYTGDSPLFSGITNSEVYLIKAECEARQGQNADAMNDLNVLLKNRFNSSFAPKVAENADGALEIILNERRKELLFRGLRWMDLKRLNLDSRFQTTLTRIVNGTTYTLVPNDPRYVYPIPDSEVLLSGIEQNSRK